MASVTLLATAGAIAVVSPASAYKCTGTTNGQQHTYQGGACYNGTTLVADEKPVNDDGSAVTSWECASGTYNASKHACETCTTFGSCEENASVTPVPKGDDATKKATSGDSGDESGGTQLSVLLKL